jgi:uracil-DNA glycosylase
MVIFVGDKPSSKNKNKNIAFVGTKSYKNLLDWIYRMDIDINNVTLCNKHDIKSYGYIPDCYVKTPNIWLDIEDEDRVVALGKNAEKHLLKLGIEEYYLLPHPSPRNRHLNDKKYVDFLLKDCKKWINL